MLSSGAPPASHMYCNHQSLPEKYTRSARKGV